eukprot:TRINITY_DN17562_c0_g1_i1.p1 TRINITY_DN17562_c0_g1~~TRINITY_DN17562_c0_g1_i1.p1  ORF type:complete len:570 (-),score=65.42 TRINITY_DN17562_c0_g1_i1:270-1760(-)
MAFNLKLLVQGGLALMVPLSSRRHRVLRQSRDAKVRLLDRESVGLSQNAPPYRRHRHAFLSKLQRQWASFRLVLSLMFRQGQVVKTSSGVNDVKPVSGQRITLVGAVVNVVLACLKLLVGLSSKSMALVADAGHSLSDLIGDGVTLWAVHMASMPPDEEHPYGHGRFESVGALGVGVLVVFAGMGIAKEALVELRDVFSVHAAQTSATPTSWALQVCILSILSKELLYRATDAVGRQLNSPVLRANASHHRSDAWSSVVAGIGIVGSLFGFQSLDPFAAMVVAFMVLRMGLDIMAESLSHLTDTTDRGIIKSVEAAALCVPGAADVKEVRARAMGSQWQVEAVVAPSKFVHSVTAAAHLAAQVRQNVLTEVPEAQECLVRVHSSSLAEFSRLQSLPDPQEIDSQVRQILAPVSEILEVKRTMTHYDFIKYSPIVEVWIQVSPRLAVEECSRIADRSRQLLLASELDLAHADVHLALPGSNSPAPQEEPGIWSGVEL